MIGKTILHYKILENLGEGGMGIVYKAEDTKLDRTVAIKFLPYHIAANAEARERFKIEAKAAAALNHPNIATIYTIEETDDEIFIVMEYIEGRELRNIIQSEIANPQSALDYATQIAGGLQAAHQKGIIHRDIKSANIMVTEEGRIKIMDFGIAKMRGVAGVTRVGDTLGTTAYMSPEQIKGEAVDHRCDIWAFGILLYEMITAELPFKGDYEVAVLYAVLNEEPLPLNEYRSDVPGFLQEVVDSCLQKDPDQRAQSFPEINGRLRQDQSPIERYPEVGAEKTVYPGRKSPKTIMAAIIASAIIGLLVLITVNFSLIQSWFGGILPSKKHILILPFKNFSQEAADQAFCDGLVEILSSKLTQLEQFQDSMLVVPASEVRQTGISSASEARKHFGANLVISGSVQRTADQIKLTMNLIDAKKLRQINSVILSESIQARSDFQDKVVSKLTEMLQFEMKPRSQRIVFAGNTNVTQAFEYYLQGRGYLLNYSQLENIDNAIFLFQQAITEDSSYALAHAGLGEAYWRKYGFTHNVKWVDSAIVSCDQALKLNDLLAPVHITLGIIYRGTGKYQEAVKEFRAALEIDPVNSDAFRELAGAYADQGKFEEVEKTYSRAIELKPNYWANYYELGLFYYQGGEFELANEQFLRVVKLSPLNFKAYRNLCGIYLAMERYAEAREMCKQSIAIQPNYGAYSNLGTLYFINQDFQNAARMLEEALKFNDQYYLIWGNLAFCYDQLPAEQHKATDTFKKAIKMAAEELKVNPNDPIVNSDLASYYSNIRMEEKALQYLNRALELASENVEVMFIAAETYCVLGKTQHSLKYIEMALERGYSPQKIKRSPALTPLHGDSEFQKLLQVKQ